MNFEWALQQMRYGARVGRGDWESGLIFLVPGSRFKVNRPPLLGLYPEGTEVEYHAHIDMRTAQGYIVPWVCSQTDLLADDWFGV